jgi:XTP/dITP diphosphohydrolase
VNKKPTLRPRLVLATGNRHKAGEIRDLLGSLPIQLPTAAELSCSLEIDETGDSYEANALLKARAILARISEPVIAEDSGLEVDALDGAPGIRSARFARPGADDQENNAHLLRMLEGVPEEGRQARFICVAVLESPPEHPWPAIVCRAEWPGRIALEPAGSSGFGYDPLFVIPSEGRTVAELGTAYKRLHSHRARAFRMMAERLHLLVGSG